MSTKLSPNRSVRAAAAATAVAACTWVAALFVPLTRVGLGSGESSHQLSDLVLSRQLGAAFPRVFGFAMYAVGLLGCFVLATCMLWSTWMLCMRLVASALATATAISVGTQVAGGNARALGPAVWLSMGAFAAVVAACSLASWCRLLDRTPEQSDIRPIIKKRVADDQYTQ